MVMNCPFDSPMPTLMLGTSPLEARVSTKSARPRRDSPDHIVRLDVSVAPCVSPRPDCPHKA